MNCENCIYVGTNGTQTVSTNSNVLFNRVIRRDGRRLDLIGAQPTIASCGQRYYLVTFSATVSAAAAGDVEFVLTKNDDTIISSARTETIATANTEFRTIEVTGIIKTPCCRQMITLGVLNTGIEAVYTNATMTIVDIDR